MRTDTPRLRGLLDRETAKETQFHDARLARILDRESLDRRVDGQQGSCVT